LYISILLAWREGRKRKRKRERGEGGGERERQRDNTRKSRLEGEKRREKHVNAVCKLLQERPQTRK
jgi:hypothetical protein